jgi:hypothetical protein
LAVFSAPEPKEIEMFALHKPQCSLLAGKYIAC